MNWNKVLNVFIMIFLIMNFFLYFYQQRYEANKYVVTSSRQTQMTNFLEARGVTMYTFIPEYYPKSQLELVAPKINKEEIVERIIGDGYESRMDNLNYAERMFNDNGELTFYIGEQSGQIYYKAGLEQSSFIPKDMTDSEVEKTIIEFSKMLFGEDVVMEATYWNPDERVDDDGDLQKGYWIEMNELYKEDIVFQSYIKLFITEDGIQEALAVRFEPLAYIGDDQHVYPFDEIIYNLVYYIEEEGGLEIDETLEGMSIRYIDIGYYIIDIDGRNSIYQADPHYRIIFESGDIYYVNAYTNAVHKQ